MAEYVADTSEQHNAELSGTYTTDEANKVLTFGNDGQGDTLFVLPAASEWLLIEVYDVEDAFGDIGYQKYTNRVDTIASELIAARTIALAEYTLFNITAVHYKGDDTADVYRGDESTAITLDNAGISYTPPVASWKLSNDTISPIHQKLICADSYDCDIEWICDP